MSTGGDDGNVTSSCPELDPNWPDEFPEASKEAGLAVFILWCVFLAATAAVLYSRRNYAPLRSRSAPLTFASIAIGGTLCVVAAAMREHVGRDVFPCAVFLPATILTFPGLLSPLIARLFRHHARVEWQIKLSALPVTDRTDLELANLLAYKYRSSMRRAYLQTFGLMACCVAVVIIYQVSQERYLSSGCVGCQMSFADIVMNLALLVVLGSMTVVGIRRLPTKIGTRTIKHEEVEDMKYALIVLVVFSVLFGLAFQLDPGGLEQSGVFAWGYILVMAMFVFAIQVVWYPSYRSLPLACCGGQREGRKSLDDVLRNSTLAQALEVFLMREFAVENYRFLVEVAKWKAAKPVQKEEDRGEEDVDVDAEMCSWLQVAVLIYTTFVEENALLQVNLAWATRMNLKEIYEEMTSCTSVANKKGCAGMRKSGALPVVDEMVFDDAVREIKALLEFDSLSRFLLSPEYRDAKGGSSAGPSGVETTVVSFTGGAASEHHRGSTFQMRMSQIEKSDGVVANYADETSERW